MPFLSVITRTYKRPNLLKVNQASLAAQDDPDYEQIILEDTEGKGIAAATLALREVEVSGEYVMVLDDDDKLIDNHLISDLKELTENLPSAVVVKMNHLERGILPDVWNTRDIPRAHIGISALIVREDVWKFYRTYFAPKYDGDYEYLSAVLQSVPLLVWHDKVVSQCQRISMGAPE